MAAPPAMNGPAVALGRPRGRVRRWRLLAGFAVLTLLGWAGGLVWFIGLANDTPPPPPVADGIVALTGGAERIEAALRLLQGEQAGKLLISGIGGGTDLAALTHRIGLDPAPIASRVTLGRAATSTRGNAVETAAWASDNGIRSLIVVTAFYHMPRALMELRRSLPGVRLLPYPVRTGSRTEAGQRVVTRLLLEEYNKYLLALAGVSAWLSTRDMPRNGRSG
jgi:uncharacterized SAM-binding protein YcdF (DUF218 family)